MEYHRPTRRQNPSNPKYALQKQKVINGSVVMATALGLGACRNSESSTEASTTTVSGFAIKGPLDDFRVFIDGNLNGIYDAGEAVAISGTDGAFSLQGPAGQTLHGEVTSTTIDAASGRVIAGHFAAAPAARQSCRR
ncbi:hypothetical protein [Yoonia sp. TsM2_T14_4]|uniref:hypothetical protein n=1 Tax=Yoonia sp. TsM2_T14_4 TaxID=3415141 RepID=UPI003C7104D4